MVALVTLDEAKDYLEIESTDHDAELTLTISAVSSIVMRHVKKTDPADIPEDDLEILRLATLFGVGNASRFKGDEENPEGVLSTTVKDILRSLRDPTLA